MKKYIANNRKLLITLIAYSVTVILSAQSIEQAFVSMPDEYYLSLPSAQRREMVKAYKTDTTAKRNNKFRGKSSILNIDSTNNFMSIQNSPNGKVDLKILKGSNPETPSYFALIFTACAQICDSHIGFYSTDWVFLKNSLLPKVTITDFLDTKKIETDEKKVSTVAEQFDIVFLETSFIGNGNDIEVKLNSESYMDKESFSRIKGYLLGDKILFTWTNNSYKKAKCYW